MQSQIQRIREILSKKKEIAWDIIMRIFKIIQRERKNDRLTPKKSKNLFFGGKEGPRTFDMMLVRWSNSEN